MLLPTKPKAKIKPTDESVKDYLDRLRATGQVYNQRQFAVLLAEKFNMTVVDAEHKVHDWIEGYKR